MQTEPRPAAPLPFPGDPLIGQVLHDRFRVLEPLGAGGMGRVYRALQVPLERMEQLLAAHTCSPASRASSLAGGQCRRC
ncbi:hypothetical protein [Corallococcus llansteffanensis]|uniref:Protein kinase domain-containing protein n=1 Tax=Corallococcus llansteffanensis TaxID=2316731 RepID=A0A3A8PQ74_9BACT|nr:hypothetical protein [Corallococcus llansteffanensis]RKH56921.1 hypothetical protein D7V93_19300 [Corallococcus llansteffanensis]